MKKCLRCKKYVWPWQTYVLVFNYIKGLLPYSIKNWRKEHYVCSKGIEK